MSHHGSSIQSWVKSFLAADKLAPLDTTAEEAEPASRTLAVHGCEEGDGQGRVEVGEAFAKNVEQKMSAVSY